MKTKKFILLPGLVLPLLFSCMTMSMRSVTTSLTTGETMPDAEKTIENQDVLEMDTIAFETDDLLAIRRKLGAAIAQYRRIPNSNYKVYSAKVYSTGGRELYTLVPVADQFGIQIHIKNTQGGTGKVEITARPKMGFASVTLEYAIKTDFFAEPYDFLLTSKTDITPGFSPDIKTHSQYVLYFKGNPVLGYLSVSDLSNPANNRVNIIADHDFLSEHEHDLAAWCVIFILINDVNRQIAADTPPSGFNNSNPRSSGFNNDGSFDHNNNPFDKF